MNAITIPYAEFKSESLINIFKLADILGVTPKRASEIYLVEKSKAKLIKQTDKPAA